MHTSAKSSYVYGLDAIRYLCSVMVCVFHLTWHQPDMVRTLPFGWIGVQIFFVISGVVIAGSSSEATRLHFLKKRFFRLYPAAWIAAIINFAILAIVPLSVYNAMGIVVDPTLMAGAQSIVLFGANFLASAYWTLPIELAFYVVIFVFACGGGWARLRPIARLLTIVSAPFLVVLAASHTGMLAMAPLDFGYGLKNIFLLRHGVFFAIGIYLWAIKHGRQLGRIDRVFIVAALLAGALEIYARAAQVFPHYAVGLHGNVARQPLAFTAVILFFVFVALIHYSLRHAEQWVPGARGARWLRTLGLVTYPFYLLHEIVGGVVLDKMVHITGNPRLSLAIAVAAVTFVAYLVARHGEPWLTNALRRDARKAIVPAPAGRNL